MAVADWLIVVACLGDGRHDITDLALPKGFEHGFHIHDWGSIDCLEVSHLHAEILGGKNFDHVYPRAGWDDPGTCDEYALHGSACIVSGMHLANAPVRQVKPGDHDDVGAGSQPVECASHVRIEHQPTVGSAFVALAWSRREIRQGRLHPSDRS